MPGRTPSQTVGPFFGIGLCREPQSEIVPAGSILISGRVFDGAGEPVPDAIVELWQPDNGHTLWGRCGTDVGGRFEFRTEKPASVRGEAPWLGVMLFARGLLSHLITRIYFPDEASANEADPVLSALEPADRERIVATEEDDDSLRFDIYLQGDRQTVFFAL
jgi:protocatechuate 3,4-dioxygenase, alpha subunit